MGWWDFCMRHDRLLELIWQGDVKLGTGPGARRLQRAMAALLPLRMVCLEAASGVDRSVLMTDDTELLPELPIGDVLVEELAIDVPVGSLVVLREADLLTRPMLDDEISYDLGVLVAEALLGIIRSGAFPVERETDALYAMARSYHAMIGGTGFMHLGLVPAQFRVGLAAGLCTYWAGTRSARSDTSGLFLRPDFLTCPRMLNYLRDMDSNFTAPDRIPVGLMLFSGGPCTYDDWLAQVARRVNAELDGHLARSCDGGSQKELRI
jgi:hypothetical protein